MAIRDRQLNANSTQIIETSEYTSSYDEEYLYFRNLLNIRY